MISCYVENSTGRITLQRPEVLNALSYEMCLEMEQALNRWKDDKAITQVIIDAQGDRAFCAGGDIAKLYHTGSAGDYGYGHKFWTDEYRLNTLIAHYPKPYIAFLHGYVMGGGVGISCHGSHRIVELNAKIAMPECAIGLIPDVGGTYLLAKAPSNVGLFLGLTGMRMNASDALYAGFADICMDENDFESAKKALIEAGTTGPLADFAVQPGEPGKLEGWADELDSLCTQNSVWQLAYADTQNTEIKTFLDKAFAHSSPLAMLCCAEIIHRLENDLSIEHALDQEYRYSYRSMEHGDLLEGIRAAIIDKDRNPRWRFKTCDEITPDDVAFMLAPTPQSDLGS